MRVTTGRGQVHDLGRQLGEGGEGVVYEVSGLPLVAKLLLDPADPAHLVRRLDALVRRAKSPRTARLLAGTPPRVAWPVQTVRALSSAGQVTSVHGFLMPDLRRWFRPLGLPQPGPPACGLAAATWETSLVRAGSLARLVADLHAAGYVVGDLKPGNLWVDDHGNVAASDVDSLQFSDGSGTFPCLSRTPDYTAPECTADAAALPDPAGDNFVLAVVIYQLLMAGMHPFAGIPADGTRYMSIDDNIAHARARVVRRDAVRPMPGSPPLSALPRRLRDLFTACFRDTGITGRTARPGPLDWAAALDAERAAGRLRTCPANPRHVFTIERPWCPWCDISVG